MIAVSSSSWKKDIDITLTPCIEGGMSLLFLSVGGSEILMVFVTLGQSISQSNNATDKFFSAIFNDKFVATVVFPTPPFPEYTPIFFFIDLRLSDICICFIIFFFIC